MNLSARRGYLLPGHSEVGDTVRQHSGRSLDDAHLARRGGYPDQAEPCAGEEGSVLLGRANLPGRNYKHVDVHELYLLTLVWAGEHRVKHEQRSRRPHGATACP